MSKVPYIPSYSLSTMEGVDQVFLLSKDWISSAWHERTLGLVHGFYTGLPVVRMQVSSSHRRLQYRLSGARFTTDRIKAGTTRTGNLGALFFA